MCSDEEESLDQQEGIENKHSDHPATFPDKTPNFSNGQHLGEGLEIEVDETGRVRPTTFEIQGEEAGSRKIETNPSNADLDEVSDDLVRMYLHEAGQVPLLSFTEQKALARNVEAKRHIEQMDALWQERYGTVPSAIDIMLTMLSRVGQALPFVEALADELDLPGECVVSQTLYYPRLRDAINGDADNQLIMTLAGRMEVAVETIENILMNLSLDLRILPQGLLQQLEEKNLLTHLTDAAHQPRLRQIVAPYEGEVL
ncbi:MAG: sigma-70 factor domain-containing protein, partial [Dehalococcoidia bacterium]